MPEFIAVTTRNYDEYAPQDFEPHLPAEVERARTLHAERVFRTIWTRGDGGGVVVLMEAEDLAAAEAVWASLPLFRAGMITAEIHELRAYHGFAPAGTRANGTRKG